jgi:hypothetical protein
MGALIGLILAGFAIIGSLARLMMPSADTPLGDSATDANRAAAYELVGTMATTVQGFTTMQTKGVAVAQVLFNGSETGLNGSAAAMITDTTSVYYTRQIFLPGVGTLTSAPKLPASASANADPRTGVFYYRNNIAFQGGAGAVPLQLGTSATEIAMFAPNIRTGVCLSVNAQMNNDSEEDPSLIPASGLALSAFTGTDATPTTMVTAPAGLGARTGGCVSTTDGAYVVFMALAKR